MAQNAYLPYPLPMGGPDEAILLARLRAQVEFYFSPQNLARDTFLTSILKQYGNAVPLETIATFPKVRELHAIGRLGMVNVPRHAMPPADPFFLCRALEGSLVVTVSNNGQWIHLNTDSNVQQHEHGKATPNQESGETTYKSLPSSPSSPSTTASSAGVPTHPIEVKERMTLLVQNVPQECTKDEIMKAFSTNAFQPKEANHSGGNTWLVTFSNEKEAMAALSATHNQTIHGVPIQASIQNEGIVMPAAPLPPPQSIPVQMPAVGLSQHLYAYPVMLQGYPVHDPLYYGPPVVPQHYQYYGYGVPVPPHNVMYAPPQQPVQAAYASVPVHQPDLHDPRNLHSNYGYAMPPLDMRGPKKNSRSRRGRGSNNNNNNRNRHQDPNDTQNGEGGNGQNNYEGHGTNNHDHRDQKRNVTNEDDHLDQQNALQYGNDGSIVNVNNDGPKKKRNTKKSKRKQQERPTGVLNQDQFPALNGGGKMSTATPSADGYAAALKKQPKKSTNGTSAAKQTPNAESSAHAQLEQDMTKLRVSNTADTEPEVWGADESSVAEMW